MNIDTMRRIDYFIGIPIIFILSFINKIFYSEAEPNTKSVLFIELVEMGSVVISAPMLKEAKEKFDDINFLIFKGIKESVSITGLIPEDNIFIIDCKNMFAFIRTTISTLFKIREKKIEVVIDMVLFSRFSTIFSYLSGARTRVGFDRFYMEGLYRGNLNTHKVTYNPYHHILLNYFSLLYSLDSSDTPFLKRSLDIDDIELVKRESTEKDKELLLEKLMFNSLSVNGRKIVILNPNASKLIPLRRWPIENYCKLAKRLLENKELCVVITGLSKEKQDAREIINYVKNSRCIDFTGQTTMKELVDLYNVSEVLITNDSGPAHFANLTSIKVIDIFSVDTPKLYGTLSRNGVCLFSDFSCSPCMTAYNKKKSPCKDAKCLKAITVGMVYKLFKDMMDNKKIDFSNPFYHSVYEGGKT